MGLMGLHMFYSGWSNDLISAEIPMVNAQLKRMTNMYDRFVDIYSAEGSFYGFGKTNDQANLGPWGNGHPDYWTQDWIADAHAKAFRSAPGIFEAPPYMGQGRTFGQTELIIPTYDGPFPPMYAYGTIFNEFLRSPVGSNAVLFASGDTGAGFIKEDGSDGITIGMHSGNILSSIGSSDPRINIKSSGTITLNPGGTTGSFVGSGSVLASNGTWIVTNAIANWPTAPVYPGAAWTGSSNGYPYILLSTNGGGGGSATWTATNKLGW